MKSYIGKSIDTSLGNIKAEIVRYLEDGLVAKMAIESNEQDKDGTSSFVWPIIRDLFRSPELKACMKFEERSGSKLYPMYIQLEKVLSQTSSEEDLYKYGNEFNDFFEELSHGNLKAQSDYVVGNSFVPVYYALLFMLYLVDVSDLIFNYYANSPSELLHNGEYPFKYESVDIAYERIINSKSEWQDALKNEIINICPDVNPDTVLASKENYEVFFNALKDDARRRYAQVYSNLYFYLDLLWKVESFQNPERLYGFEPKLGQETDFMVAHVHEPKTIAEMMKGQNAFKDIIDGGMDNYLDFLDDKTSPFAIKAEINSILDNSGYDELIAGYKEKHAARTSINRAVPYDLFDERPNYDEQEEFIPAPTSDIKFLNHDKSYEEQKDKALFRFQRFLTYLYEEGYLNAVDIPLFVYRMTGRNRPEGELPKIKWRNVHDRPTDHGPELLYIVQGLSEAGKNKFDRLPLFFDGPDFKCKPKDAAASFKKKLNEIYPDLFKVE